MKVEKHEVEENKLSRDEQENTNNFWEK